MKKLLLIIPLLVMSGCAGSSDQSSQLASALRQQTNANLPAGQKVSRVVCVPDGTVREYHCGFVSVDGTAASVVITVSPDGKSFVRGQTLALSTGN